MTAGNGQVRLQRSLDNGLVQLLLRATNAGIAGLVGTSQFKIFVMVNTKYYKNLRKLYRSRNRDQAISLQASTEDARRTPGTGLKLQAPSSKLQASSSKLR